MDTTATVAELSHEAVSLVTNIIVTALGMYGEDDAASYDCGVE